MTVRGAGRAGAGSRNWEGMRGTFKVLLMF